MFWVGFGLGVVVGALVIVAGSLMPGFSGKEARTKHTNTYY